MIPSDDGMNQCLQRGSFMFGRFCFGPRQLAANSVAFKDSSEEPHALLGPKGVILQGSLLPLFGSLNVTFWAG